MLEFLETESPIDIAEISRIEKRFDLTFPSSYTLHVLEQNGGRPNKKIVRFLEDGRQTASDVDWFLGISKGPYDNLERYLETYILDQRLPNYLLPFAHDSGGNLYCVRTGESSDESVYFWNHERETLGASRCLSLLARSFADFLQFLEFDVWPLSELKSIYEPTKEIDKAKVLCWAWSGEKPFFILDQDSSNFKSEIFGIAICQYAGSDEIYRFACGLDWQTENDSIFSSVEEAKYSVERHLEGRKIVWKSA